MARHGTKFIMETVPSSVHKTDDGRLRVCAVVAAPVLRTIVCMIPYWL